MIQRILGAAVVAGGIYLLVNDSLIVGVLLLVFGAAFFNGASQNTLFCFHFGDDNSGCSDGGDGGD